MAKAAGLVRAETIHRMADAYVKGLSASKFIAKMRAAGLSYRRTDMLADWRAVTGIKAKEGLLKFVRKDRYPTTQFITPVPWDLKHEFLYKVKVWTQTRPGVPLESRFVNIVNNAPLTIGQVEAEVWERWSGWEKYDPQKIVSLGVETVIQKITP